MTDKINEISTPALAYLGDAVTEICVRTLLVELGISDSKHLNEEALSFVRAGAQAEAARAILPSLDDGEAAAYRRGRNLGHTNVPKSASMSEYRQATGLETLFGYLHMLGREERIKELFRLAYADKINALSEKVNEGGFK